MNVGDEVEFKASAGLGGWRRGTLVELDDRSASVRERNTLHIVPRSRVRALEEDAPRRPPAARARPPAETGTMRRVDASGGGLRAVPKPPAPLRSERYLDFIRIRPCCACGRSGPSDPHHYGPRGAGQKTDDYRVVPLCRICHDLFHAKRVLPSCRDVADTKAFILETQVRLLIEFIALEG